MAPGLQTLLQESKIDFVVRGQDETELQLKADKFIHELFSLLRDDKKHLPFIW